MTIPNDTPEVFLLPLQHIRTLLAPTLFPRSRITLSAAYAEENISPVSMHLIGLPCVSDL